MNISIQYQTLKSNVSHAGPPMAPYSLIGGHEAMEPWDHPIGGHAWPTILFSVWLAEK